MLKLLDLNGAFLPSAIVILLYILGAEITAACLLMSIAKTVAADDTRSSVPNPSPQPKSSTVLPTEYFDAKWYLAICCNASRLSLQPARSRVATGSLLN